MTAEARDAGRDGGGLDGGRGNDPDAVWAPATAVAAAAAESTVGGMCGDPGVGGKALIGVALPRAVPV